MGSLKDSYEILGIASDASLQDIKTAFLAAERLLEADFASADPDVSRRAEERLRQISEAHRIVFDHYMQYGPPKFVVEKPKASTVADKPERSEAHTVARQENPPVPSPPVESQAETVAPDSARPAMPQALYGTLIGVLALFVVVSAGTALGIFFYTHSQQDQETTPRKVVATAPVSNRTSSATLAPKDQVTAKQEEQPKVRSKKHKTHRVVKRHSIVNAVAMDAHEVQRIMRGAEQGNPEDQYSLGVILSKGLGVRKDREAAIRWYRRAAGQGHRKAQEALEIYHE